MEASPIASAALLWINIRNMVSPAYSGFKAADILEERV
jgi:hypothetical protein